MKTKNLILIGLAGIAVSTILLPSCSSIPKSATAVQNFNKEKYLGKWYEIARLDFKFEKNLDNTTANYSLRPDGKIKVTNRGYNFVTKEFKESIGKAKFVGDEQEAKLKVSFFGPFYSGYNVVAIDPHYKYALVCGKNLKYLWILSRETTIPENIKNSYLEKAKAMGYQIEDLVWVKHDKN